MACLSASLCPSSVSLSKIATSAVLCVKFVEKVARFFQRTVSRLHAGWTEESSSDWRRHMVYASGKGNAYLQPAFVCGFLLLCSVKTASSVGGERERTMVVMTKSIYIYVSSGRQRCPAGENCPSHPPSVILVLRAPADSTGNPNPRRSTQVVPESVSFALL